ncbi:MAG: hypothetical protein WCP21_03735 [Armatimonadota bacterium]
MSDDQDGYLDISLDDEEDGTSQGDVLDLTLDGDPVRLSPPRARRPDNSAQLQPSATSLTPELPMVATGVCSQCGYALRPLEEVCPRCQRSVHDAVEKSVEKSAPDSATGTESPLPSLEPLSPSPQRHSSLFTVAGLILFLVLAAGIPLYLWTQPEARAKREYRAGLTAQLAGNFEGARGHYQQALGLDPRMGLAAFSLGTTYLRIGDPAMMQSIQQITEKAVWGQTGDLNEADKWFQQAVTIGQAMPPDTRLMDQRISDPPRLRAFAHACMALTALIRASAAMQADQLDDAMTWFEVAAQLAQAAVVDDPSNASANQILRQIPPFAPTSGAASP